MSAESRLENEITRSAMADPLYFDSGEHRLFGWLHRPSPDPRTKFGLIVCKPFGYEAICAHRSVRAFSEAAAELGVPTLRFDYAGTGDSAPLDPRANQLAVWIQDVISAAAELRRHTGVEQIYLLGFRFGALLATLAASRIDGMGGLILIAPIVNGRRYVRELRVTRLAATMGSPLATAGGAGAESVAVKSADLEISGFTYSAATLAALSEVDLSAPRELPAAKILVIDGINMPGARGWAEQLSALGAQISYQALSGLIEMTMTAPQFAAVPHEMIKAMRDWVAQLEGPHPGVGAAGEVAQRTSFPAQTAELLTLPSDDGSVQPAPIVERAAFLASQPMLFGIVTEPGQGELRRGAVILINAGADYHIGANGMNVALARRWARSGYVVLRMDLAGLGDSGVRPGQPINAVFPPAALDDIRTAIEWMRNGYSVSSVTICGMCSGAYHALRAATSGLPVNQILMVNPETFFWDETMSIHDMQLSEVVKETASAGRKGFSAATWKRLLRGQIDVGYVLRRRARRHVLAIDSKLRDAARRLRIRLPHDLGFELEETIARGVRMLFVFSRGEPGIELLRMQAGISMTRLGKSCRIHIVDGADHVFSKLGARMALENMLSDELFADT